MGDMLTRSDCLDVGMSAPGTCLGESDTGRRIAASASFQPLWPVPGLEGSAPLCDSRQAKQSTSTADKVHNIVIIT